MTFAELNQRLKSTGLPVTYRAWEEGEAPAMPYVCYRSTGSDGLYADAEMYLTWDLTRVELYTRLKDLAAEAKVEAALKGIRWEKTETYIDTEKCYMILYEIEV